MSYSLEEDIKRINDLPREKFEQLYMALNEMLWEMPGITMEDLAEIKKESDDQDDDSRNFFSDEKIRGLLNVKPDVKYSDDESMSFIREVKASNVTDISESGYFYKKICNCLDDVFIEKDDCGSDGISYDLKDIDENVFLFYIKDCYISEFDDYFTDYFDLLRKSKDAKLETIHVRTPLTCKMAPKRCFCQKCCGNIDTGGRKLTSKNIGFITSLCVTESATQASLSSMNEGTSENVNVILEKRLPDVDNWDDAIKIIKERIDMIGYHDVQARWYYISLISRYVKDEKTGRFKATSYKTNSNYGEDLLGAYIFEHTANNLKKMINKREFRLTSLKSKNLFGIY